MYEKPVKTPLDVLENWKPSKEFVEGLEEAYKKRNRFKFKKVKL